MTARPEQRPTLRPTDDRTATILAGLDGGDFGERDKFYVDPANIPDGMSVEWKRVATVGKPDRYYEAELSRMGWEAAPADLFPGILPPGATDTVVEREGMLLMMRDSRITAKVQELEYRKATGKVRDHAKRLGAEPLGKSTFSANVSKLNTSFEPGLPVGD